MSLSTKPLSSKSPFTFDLSFDDSLNDDTPHILTTREINEKFEEGRKQGFEEGQKAAQESLTAGIKLLLESIYYDVNNLTQHKTDFESSYSYEVAEACRQIALVFYEQKKAKGLQEDVLGFFERHYEKLRNTPWLTLSVAPSYHQEMEAAFKEHQPGLLESVKVVSDGTIPENSYQLRWENGSLIRDIDAIQKEILAVFDETHADIKKDHPDMELPSSTQSEEVEKALDEEEPKPISEPQQELEKEDEEAPEEEEIRSDDSPQEKED